MADRYAYAERDKTLVLVSRRFLDDVTNTMSQLGCSGWSTAFEIRVLPERRDACEDLTSVIYDNTYNIISEYAEQRVRNVLALPHLAVDLQRLKEEEIPLRETNTVVTMCKVLGEELRARRLHWEDFSHDEWQKSTLGLTTPKQWVQQFGELGFSNIGRQLLKGLRVITERELRDAFSVSRDQIVGLRVGYAYIKDDEAGSSSLSIKNILEHYYPSKDVFAVDLNSIDRLTEMDKDVVFVFEDGLWSGVELVRRLKTIHASEPFRQGSLQLHFRYGATSDSGLIAARLFARRERSSRVQFSAASTGYHFRFLRPSVESEVTRILTEDDDFIRKLLDTAVEPYAFREDVGWGQERDEAISICSEIGRQLVLPFLRRKKTRPNTTEQSEAQVAYADIADDDIRKWELGASRFASTVVFATSIPKPVLPLMWLSGKVTLKERTVNWKPLFWDVRRTGTVAN